MDINLIIGSGGLLGIGYIIFKIGKVMSSFEGRFDKIDSEIKEIKCEMKEIRKDISVLSSRIDRLEVRVEERTLKVIHVQKTYGEIVTEEDRIAHK